MQSLQFFCIRRIFFIFVARCHTQNSKKWNVSRRSHATACDVACDSDLSRHSAHPWTTGCILKWITIFSTAIWCCRIGDRRINRIGCCFNGRLHNRTSGCILKWITIISFTLYCRINSRKIVNRSGILDTEGSIYKRISIRELREFLAHFRLIFSYFWVF